MQDTAIETNVIKLRFVRGGQPSGREYTYFTPVDVEVGDLVEMEAREGIAKGVITQINVPEEEIAPFRDKAKTIIGKVQPKEEAEPDGQTE